VETIINKIISIENNAREVLYNTNKEKEKKHEEMIDITNKLKDKILHDANRKVEQLRKRELEEAKAKAQAYITKAEKDLENMKEYSAQHKEKWRDELLKAVLER
jgi:hypothetical protein